MNKLQTNKHIESIHLSIIIKYLNDIKTIKKMIMINHKYQRLMTMIKQCFIEIDSRKTFSEIINIFPSVQMIYIQASLIHKDQNLYLYKDYLNLNNEIKNVKLIGIENYHNFQDFYYQTVNEISLDSPYEKISKFKRLFKVKMSLQTCRKMIKQMKFYFVIHFFCH